MAKVPKSYPTGSQLESGEKALENNPVSNVSNYNNGIVWGGVNSRKYGPQATIGTELDTRIPAPEIRASRNPSAKGYVALNESGTQRIGEYHAGAKLTDAQVEEIRDRYEASKEGLGPRIGYRRLAQEYGVGKRTIRDIVSYSKRNQWAARWKKVPS